MSSESKNSDDGMSGQPSIKRKFNKITPTQKALGNVKTQTQPGVFFQIYVLVLYIYRALNKSNCDFLLMMEHLDARFLEDIIYQYKDDGGKLCCRFIQTKHTKKSLTISQLFRQAKKDRDNKFGIRGYFLAFCKIKCKRFFTKTTENEEIELKEFTILTNTDFNDVVTGKKRNLGKLKKWKNYLQQVDDTTISEKLLYVNGMKKYIFKIPPEEIINDEQLMLKTRLDTYIGQLRENVKKEDEKSNDYKKLKDEITKLENMSQNFKATVQEFFNKFNFVTNYSNRENLEELIKNEMAVDFKLSDVTLQFSMFYKEIEDWWGGKKITIIDEGMEKEVSYFTAAYGKQLLAHISSKQMLSGLCEWYIEKLSNYGINFNENLCGLETFLSGQDKIMHIYSEAPRITAIKVFKTLQSEEFQNTFDYLTKKDGYIFINVKGFLRIKNSIMNSFLSEQSCNLLILEFSQMQKGDDIIKDLHNILLERSKVKNKKLILIAKYDDNFANKFIDTIKEIDDKINFADVDLASQNLILQNKIHLQGKETTLIALIDNVIAKEIIDHKILSMIIEKNIINISDSTVFSSAGYNPEYYIEKGFHIQMVRGEILKEIKTDYGWLYITGISKEDLISFGITPDDIHTQDEDKLPAKWIILPNSINSDKDSFRSLCRENQNKHVCWLNYKNDLFSYVECSLHNSSLTDCMPTCLQMTYLNLNLENVKSRKLDFRTKVVVLSSEAGYGKSTIMTWLAIKMKEKYSDLWISRINLNRFEIENSQKLKDMDFNENDTDGVISFISDMIIPENGDHYVFERKMFASGLRFRETEAGDAAPTYPRIVIFFDGFDEIAEIQRRNIINLIKVLRKTNVVQILITTRPHVESYLEKELVCPIYKLYNLFHHEQVTLLSRFLKWNLMFSIGDGCYLQNDDDFEKIMELLKILESSLKFISDFKDDEDCYHDDSYHEDSYYDEDIYHEDSYHDDIYHEDCYDEDIDHDESYDEDSYHDDIYREDSYHEDCYDEEIYHEDIYHEDSYHDDSYHEDCYDEDIYHDDSYHDDCYDEDIYHEDCYDEDIYHDDSYHEESYNYDIYHVDSYHDDIYREDSYDEDSDVNSIKRLYQGVSKILKKNYHQQNDTKFDDLRDDLRALKFDDYSEWLIKNWYNSEGNHKDKSLEKVPLFLIMIGKLFVEMKFGLPEKLNVNELFNKIIQRNFDIYLLDKVDTKEQDKCGIYQREIDNLWHLHHKFSLRELEFIKEEEEIQNILKLAKYKENEIINMGLLTRQNDQLKFTHRTLAEYLVSDYICNHLKDDIRAQQSFVQILIEDKYKLVRFFLNKNLSKLDSENNPLFKESLTNEIKRFSRDGNLTIFNYSVKEGLNGIITFVVDNYNGDKIDLLLETDRFGETSFYKSATHRYLEIFKVLLKTAAEKKANFHDKFNKLILASDSYGRTILHNLSSKYEPEFYEIAIEEFLKAIGDDKECFRRLIQSQDFEEQTFLHRGCHYNEVDVIKILLKKIKDAFKSYDENLLRKLIFQTDIAKECSIEISAKNGYFEMVKNLLSFIKKDFNESSYNAFRDSLFLTEDEYEEMDKDLHLIILTGKSEFSEILTDDLQTQFQELKLIKENFEDGYTCLYFLSTIEKLKKMTVADNRLTFSRHFKICSDKIDYRNQEIRSLVRNWVNERIKNNIRCVISFSNQYITKIDFAELFYQYSGEEYVRCRKGVTFLGGHDNVHANRIYLERFFS